MHGYGIPMWVAGMGTNRSGYGYTHHLQNKSKNIFFGGELIEIWPILWKSLKFGVSQPFLHHSPHFLVGKPMWVMCKGPHRLGYGYGPRYPRVTHAISYSFCWSSCSIDSCFCSWGDSCSFGCSCGSSGDSCSSHFSSNCLMVTASMVLIFWFHLSS